MTEEVKRNYLEINSLQDLIEGNKPSEDYSLSLINPINFQLNKFFYKNIGKKHKWVDRLSWSEEKWINYVSLKNVRTYLWLIHIANTSRYKRKLSLCCDKTALHI